VKRFKETSWECYTPNGSPYHVPYVVKSKKVAFNVGSTNCWDSQSRKKNMPPYRDDGSYFQIKKRPDARKTFDAERKKAKKTSGKKATATATAKGKKNNNNQNPGLVPSLVNGLLGRKKRADEDFEYIPGQPDECGYRRAFTYDFDSKTQKCSPGKKTPPTIRAIVNNDNVYCCYMYPLVPSQVLNCNNHELDFGSCQHKIINKKYEEALVRLWRMTSLVETDLMSWVNPVKLSEMAQLYSEPYEALTKCICNYLTSEPEPSKNACEDAIRKVDENGMNYDV